MIQELPRRRQPSTFRPIAIVPVLALMLVAVCLIRAVL